MPIANPYEFNQIRTHNKLQTIFEKKVFIQSLNHTLPFKSQQATGMLSNICSLHRLQVSPASY